MLSQGRWFFSISFLFFNFAAICTAAASDTGNNALSAYVPDLGASAVFYVDVATNTATQTVTNTSGTPFSSPDAIAISSNQSFAYMADGDASAVFYIGTATNTATKTVANTSGTPFISPAGIAISPDQSFAYVADLDAPAVFYIDTATNTATQIVANTSGTPFMNPAGIAISPDQSFAYVVDLHAPAVFYINTATNTATQTVANTSGLSFFEPSGIAISPHQSFAYMADSSAHAVFYINTATNTATQTVANTSGTPFSNPVGIAISPDQSFAYMADGGAAAVYYIDIATNTATKTVTNHTSTPFTSPAAIAISSDQSFAYMADTGSSAVYYIDIATNTATQTVASTSGISFIGPNSVAFFYSKPLAQKILTQGLVNNNLALANYLNANAPPSVLRYFTPLRGSALNQALESAAPTRNAFATYAVQNACLASNQVVSDHLRQRRFYQQLKLKDQTVAVIQTEDLLAEFLQTGDLLNDFVEIEDLLADTSKQEMHGNISCVKRKPYTAWLAPFGEYAHEKAQRQTPSFNIGLGGFVAGFDFSGARAGDVLGVGGAYAHTHVHEAKEAGSASVNQGYLTIYSTVNVARGYFDLGLWGGYSHIHNRRKISLPGFHRTAESSTHGWQLAPHLEVGYDGFCLQNSCVKWFGVEPFVMGDWVATWESGFQEYGAGSLDMGQKKRFCSLLRGEMGLRFHEAFQFDWGRLVLREKGSYTYQKAFHTGIITAFLVGLPSSFTVSTLVSAQNLGVVEFSVLFLPKREKVPYFDIRYQGEFGSKYQSHQATLEIGKDF